MLKKKVFMDFALSLSNLSKCEERRVAAVITDEKLTQVLSIGINGGPAGLDNCLCNTPGKYGCVHAEINALVKCKAEGPKVMFCTLSPCKQCAASIINEGTITAVYYYEAWKEDSGIELLTKANIKCIMLSS